MPIWEKTISFARNCSWKAGPILAAKMEENNFQDWERVIVAINHEAIVGYCMLCEKDELPDYGLQIRHGQSKSYSVLPVRTVSFGMNP